MNCFHFSVSLGYKTTCGSVSFSLCLLWIAFIFQYLWDTKQPSPLSSSTKSCCELLSFFSIFGIQNNLSHNPNKRFPVVNCFHFSVSLGYKTTFPNDLMFELLLWIAFIFQYLWDTTQQARSRFALSLSCELLSFFSIFGIQNNFFVLQCSSASVVNCFHFSVSLGYKTTLIFLWWRFRQLWIAFIFQYLWDTKQLSINDYAIAESCELLSFFSIFGIQNNIISACDCYLRVVNCFHFSVSLGYKTTLDFH